MHLKVAHLCVWICNSLGHHLIISFWLLSCLKTKATWIYQVLPQWDLSVCPLCVHHTLQSGLERQVTDICPLRIGHTASSSWKLPLGYPITQEHGVVPGTGCELGPLPNQTQTTSEDTDSEDYHPPTSPVNPSDSLQSFGKDLIDWKKPISSKYLLWKHTPPMTKASSPQWECRPYYQINSGGCGIIYSSTPRDFFLRKQNESCQVWDSPEKWLCLVHMTLNSSLPPFGD